MKKINLFLMSIVAMFVAVVSVNAASLPNAQDNVITLTGDVTLDSTYQVTSGQTITIDLNGHTLTGPATGYTIDNLGTLSIKDSGSTKGKIVGNASNNSSTVRNNGTSLIIDGVTIESPFICVKNETDKTAEIKNSNLTTTTSTDYESILNYGILTATDSVLTASNRGTSVLSMNGATTTLNNCELNAKTPVGTDTNTTVNVNGGKIVGTLGTTQKGTLKVTGKVEAKLSSNVTRYLQSGSNLVVSEDDVISQNYEIGDGVTLTVEENVKFNFIKKVGSSTSVGSITVKGGTVEGTINGAKVYNKTNTTYYGLLEQALVNTVADTTNDLVLLEDTDESTTVWNKQNKLNNNKDVNLDLNGHTLKGDIVNNADKTLTIEDETGEGKLEGTISNSGTLTIENGNFNNVPTTENGGSTTLNGGTYPNDQLTNATIPEDKELVENEDGTYSILYKSADFSKLDEAVKKALELLKNKDKYTTESVEALETALEADNDALRALRLDGQEDIDAVTAAINEAIDGLETKTEKDAPETLDAASAYIGLAVLSLGASIVTVRKLRNN